MHTTVQELRKHIRQARRRISRFEQKKSAQQVLNLLRTNPQFIHSQHIGLYLDAFGEIQTQKIIEYCFSVGKKVYLPVICNMNQQLEWVRINQHQYRNKLFFHHRLGMREPMQARGLHVSKLDLLIMPLLVCDYQGTRIGMGGGYYDRTLATAYKKPYRLGLAHDLQLVETPLYREKWDQPLDALLTPTRLLRFKRL
ncbi:5-formyltetrahydrofolate cyclo-ligase [Acinetobacter sp. LoGeW2-3]|uniref:5-formyltetrahydrofolate cyclo-ligase n=1 Tax=Acinetobacter sp. LoGeW2-3 TaxID=1808001 RepID=UPI000C058E99|nr:5-formyltetrahydrofolate cyclo-ligase [Acinetobacter sp. LoGeW2-3]ATO18263.1 5-formyltetrahydrofolate cyclo-ligase [Acinetobacter sp. LoGeW2-3]